MNGFLIVLWFVFGIAGVYIGQLVNLAHNDLQPLPGDVWCVLLGPKGGKSKNSTCT